MSNPDEAQLTAIWTAATREYAATAGVDVDDPDFPHPASVEDLLQSLDRKNAEFKHFRAKRGRLFDVLQAACKPIEQLGTIVAGGTATVFPPSTLCMGAVIYLIDAARGVSSSYDAITELFEALKALLVRITVYNRESIPMELQEKLGETLATYLEVLARATKVVKAGTAGRVLSFAKNVFVGPDEKIQNLLKKLEKLCVSETRLVGAELLTESKKTGRNVEDVSSVLAETSAVVRRSDAKVSEVGTGVQQICINQEEFRNEMRHKLGNVMSAISKASQEARDKDSQHTNKIKAILRPSVNPLDILSSIKKKRVPGTGDWIQAEPLFTAWRNESDPLLWITGSPGSGKSFLSESIISYLQQEHPQGVQHPSRISIGYFFFQDSDPETRSFHQALRDIAYQICCNDLVYAKYVASACQSVHEISSISSAWRILFLNYFVNNNRTDSRAYVLIDGIDEAFQDSRQTFFEHLSDLQPRDLHCECLKVAQTFLLTSIASGNERLRVIMVGRPQISNEIAEATGNITPTISVDWRKNSFDIAQYVESSIRKSRSLSRVPKSLREEISTTLVQNAQGMFLWVDLMLRELARKTHPSSIRRALHEAPKGLKEMCDHVLETFSSTVTDEEADDLNTMLAWVACAQRPLKLGEVDLILKLRSPEEDGVFNLENNLRKQFASFFNLIRADGLTTADLQDEASIHLSATAGDDDATEGDGLNDADIITDFDSSPYTTEVVFCHASIGDYFRDRNNSKISSGDGYPAIGVETVQAKAMILKTCLREICNSYASTSEKSETALLPYALDHWFALLSELVEWLDEVDVDDKNAIGGLLITMFRDRSVGIGWVGSKSPDFYVKINLGVVIRWLKDPPFLNSLSEPDREWVDHTIQKPAKLLQLAAEIVGIQWLDCGDWLPRVCMQIIFMIKAALEGEPCGEVPSELSVEMILDTAHWTGREKNARWHCAVGTCLRESGHVEECKAYYEKALEMDDREWIARSGLAVALSRLEKYDEAIALAKTNEETIERLLKLDQRQLAVSHPDYCEPHELGIARSSIAEWYQELKDADNAQMYFRKAFESSNRKYGFLISWLRIVILDKYERATEVIQMIKSMDEKIEGVDYSRLTECIVIHRFGDGIFFNAVSRAAKATGNVEWLEDAYRAAISTCKKLLMIPAAFVLDACLADLYASWDDKDEKAEPIWDRIVTFPVAAASSASQEIRTCQNWVALTYARWLFKKALRAGLNTPVSDEYMVRLDRLCKQKTRGLKDAPEIITTTNCAMLMGRWHQLCGRDEDAKPYFQPYIKLAIMMLSDDKLENDEDAYYQLAHIFLAAEDEEYARAACSIAPAFWKEDYGLANQSPKFGDGEGQSKAAESHEEGDPSTLPGAEGSQDAIDASEEQSSTTHLTLEDIMAGPYKVVDRRSRDHIWVCDAAYHHAFGNFIGGNICRLCLVDLCDECIAPLRRGEPHEAKVCSPDHSWLHLEKPKRVVERGKLSFGEEVVTLDEFLDRVRKRWDV